MEVQVLEFHEKLQELRKSRGLTQEELAEALFVSRTAISKWESGRGYPSIDSLKEISSYFSVSIDDLLSGEQLILIAEKENKSNLNSVCDLLLGFVDLFSLMLIFLPLYPKPVSGYIYSVNLFGYVDSNMFIIRIYWALFISLTITGIVKILMLYFKFEKGKKSGYIYLCRTQYNCCFVFGYGERAVCDNSNIPVIAYQRHSAL